MKRFLSATATAFVCLGFLIACGSTSDSTRGSKVPPLDPGNQNLVGYSTSASSDGGKFSVTGRWVSPPKAEVYQQTSLTFSDCGAAICDATLTRFDPQMPSMGHGTVTNDQVFSKRSDRVDEWEVTGIYFIMGGEWEIFLNATVNGEEDTVHLKVDVP